MVGHISLTCRSRRQCFGQSLYYSINLLRTSRGNVITTQPDMGALDPTTLPPQSALQNFLTNNPPPAHVAYSDSHHNLALQIAHNLRYQHLWTDVRLHTTSTTNAADLSRPLLSGIPPTRLYLHPDEQIELLQKQKEAGKSGMPELEPQREWVLPSHLREKWTLRKFGETFDTIGTVPKGKDGQELFPDESAAPNRTDANAWREKLPKRLLLATLDDDSTVVYYIVHDGIVKPRQN